jgi:hypothetical protein
MANALEEAIAMPRSKDVGAWVAGTAKLLLEGRAALVKVVEQSSHKMPVAAQTSDPGLARAIAEAERRREHAELPTDVGAPAGPLGAVAPVSDGARPPRSEESTELATVQSTIHPVRTRPSTSRASLALGIGGGVALLAAVGVAVFVARGAREAQPDRAVAASGGPPASATGLPEPVQSAPIAWVAASASAAPPRASASGGPARGKGPPVRVIPPVTTPRSAPPGCELPFTIDDKGKKHFKPECVVDP